MTNASGCIYIEYADGKTANASLPVVTGAVPMDNSTAAVERAEEYNRNAPAGYHAGVFGVSIAKPAVTVPAPSAITGSFTNRRPMCSVPVRPI